MLFDGCDGNDHGLQLARVHPLAKLAAGVFA